MQIFDELWRPGHLNNTRRCPQHDGVRHEVGQVLGIEHDAHLTVWHTAECHRLLPQQLAVVNAEPSEGHLYVGRSVRVQCDCLPCALAANMSRIADRHYAVHGHMFVACNNVHDHSQRASPVHSPYMCVSQRGNAGLWQYKLQQAERLCSTAQEKHAMTAWSARCFCSMPVEAAELGAYIEHCMPVQ